MLGERKYKMTAKEKCGAVTCRDLKGVGTGKVLCSCEECVRNAAAIAEEVISGGK